MPTVFEEEVKSAQSYFQKIPKQNNLEKSIYAKWNARKNIKQTFSRSDWINSLFIEPKAGVTRAATARGEGRVRSPGYEMRSRFISRTCLDSLKYGGGSRYVRIPTIYLGTYHNSEKKKLNTPF